MAARLDVYEEWLRLRGLPSAECEAEIQKIEGKDPDVAREVRAMMTSSPTPPVLDRESLLGDDPASKVTERIRRYAPVDDRYEVIGEIGKGGMGEVHRVRDNALNRELARKTLKATNGSGVSGPLLSRFLLEAKITGQLDHPGVVPIHDLGIGEDGRPFFTMRLIRGKSLLDVLQERRDDPKSWSLARILQIIQRVCETMAFAHANGVIHRDLKPSNIMVGEFGEVYVADWGVAKAKSHPDEASLRIQALGEGACVDGALVSTMDGAIIGTPNYMSPEQARGELQSIDERSDVYSIGAILYETLGGERPYEDIAGSPAIVARVVTGPPVPLGREVPGELKALCEMAMERDQERRFRSVSELAGDLAAFQEGRVVSAYEAGSWAKVKKWVCRNPAMSACVVLSASLVGIGLFALNQALNLSRAWRGQLAEAATTIDAGTMLKPTHVRPAGSTGGVYATVPIDDVLDRVLARPVKEGEGLTHEHLSKPGTPVGLQSLVPHGWALIRAPKERFVISEMIDFRWPIRFLETTSGFELTEESFSPMRDLLMPASFDNAVSRLFQEQVGVGLFLGVDGDHMRLAVHPDVATGLRSRSERCLVVPMNVGSERYKGLYDSRERRNRLETLRKTTNASAIAALVLDVDRRVVLREESSAAMRVSMSLTRQHPIVPGPFLLPLTYASVIRSGTYEADSIIDIGNGSRHSILDAAGKSRTLFEAQGIGYPLISGEVSLHEAITRGSAIGAVVAGLEVPAEESWGMYSAIGFGKAWSVYDTDGAKDQLYRGFIPALPWNRRFAHASICFGYEMSTNLWQLANAFATAITGESFPLSHNDGRAGMVDEWSYGRIFDQEVCESVRAVLGDRLGIMKAIDWPSEVWGGYWGRSETLLNERACNTWHCQQLIVMLAATKAGSSYMAFMVLDLPKMRLNWSERDSFHFLAIDECYALLQPLLNLEDDSLVGRDGLSYELEDGALQLASGG